MIIHFQIEFVYLHLFLTVSLQTGQGAGDNKEKRRKESILDLSKYLEKSIRVKFAGGREAAGILKGYDPLLNLVLDNTTEFLRGMFQTQVFQLKWRLYTT